MDGRERATVEDALEAAYQNVTAVADELAEPHLILPTPCRGWAVADGLSLGLVRRVLDGLLGTPMAGGWDDRTYALKGTGRVSVTEADRSAIGPMTERLPLFG